MARETCPAMLMVLRLVAFVDIALRCDRAIRMFEEVRPVCGAKPRSWNMHAMLCPEGGDCEAPVGGGRNGGSKLRMRQELREHHDGGTAVLEPRSFRTLLTNIDICFIVTTWPPQLSACTLRLVVPPRPYHPYRFIGNSPRRAWAVGRPTGPLNHCSLGLRAFESLALRQFLLFDL